MSEGTLISLRVKFIQLCDEMKKEEWGWWLGALGYIKGRSKSKPLYNQAGPDQNRDFFTLKSLSIKTCQNLFFHKTKIIHVKIPSAVVVISALRLNSYFIDFSFGCVWPRIITSKKLKYPPPSGAEFPIWMMTKCPAQVKPNTVNFERCSAIGPGSPFDSFVPVTYSSVTYRNKYCAYCNGVSQTAEMKDWHIQIYCDDSISLTDDKFVAKMEENNCSIYFLQPDKIETQNCDREYQYEISTCNETGLWPYYDKSTDLACQSFIDPFNLTYKNYFCYLCNTDQLIPEENRTCRAYTSAATEDIMPPFSAIINLKAIQPSTEKDLMNCNVIYQLQDKKMVRLYIQSTTSANTLKKGSTQHEAHPPPHPLHPPRS